MHNPTQFAWKAIAGATPGNSHLMEGIPCQDAATAGISPRPYIAVCDGRGSAAHSDKGARRAVAEFERLIVVLQDLLAQALDAESSPAEPASVGVSASAAWRIFVRAVWRGLGKCQTELAACHSAAAEDFEFTLAAAVAGTQRAGFIQVGDSLLVAAKGAVCGLVFEPDHGDCGLATHFITPGPPPPQHVHAALISAANLTGLAALSDGFAARTVAEPQARPTVAFHGLFSDLSDGLLSRPRLHAILHAEEWHSVTGDDRALALVAPDLRGVESQ
jgi:hypothetical protein